MRLTATITIPAITIFSLLLAGCDLMPPNSMREELSKSPGPAPGSMNDALKVQAEQAAAGKDYARAAQMYHQLADKDPANHEFTLAFADNLRRAGDNENALKVLDKYLTANPADATGLELRGLCMMSLGDTQGAGKSFEAVMKTDPKRWRTLNGIGILFTLKGKLSDAVAYYDEALDNSPGNASVLNNKGITLAMDNKYNDSIASFLQTRKNLRVGTPDLQQVDMNLALVYAIAGKLDDAESTAAPYLSKEALYNNMGVYAELSKNPDLARSYLNMALTQSPVYYERAWKNLGTVTNDNTTADAPKDIGDLTKEKPVTVKKSKKPKVAKIVDPEANGTPLNQIPMPELGTPAPPIQPVKTQ